MWWHCLPDTRLEIRTLAVWGRARYVSVTEAPHNIESLRVSVEEAFRFFKIWMPERVTNPQSATFQAGSFNHCTRDPALSVRERGRLSLVCFHTMYAYKEKNTKAAEPIFRARSFLPSSDHWCIEYITWSGCASLFIEAMYFIERRFQHMVFTLDVDQALLIFLKTGSNLSCLLWEKPHFTSANTGLSANVGLTLVQSRSGLTNINPYSSATGFKRQNLTLKSVPALKE